MRFRNLPCPHLYLLLGCGLVAASAASDAASVVQVTSPDNRNTIALSTREGGVYFEVTRNERVVFSPSQIGPVLADVDLCDGTNTEFDSNGEALTGANNYTLTFAKGQTPPVIGFWSVTMYEIDKGWWFVPNELNKFTVSPRNDLKYNADGSLTLYFQNQSPGKDKEANWLPAPKSAFVPMLRMYWPKATPPSIIDGTWKVPAAEEVK